MKPAPGRSRSRRRPARALDAYAAKLRAAAGRTGRRGQALGPGQDAAGRAAAPPAKKPVIELRDGFEVEDGEDLPPVFTTVPTKDKVVFLTIDDGAEKDPAFLRMMSDLKIPYTAFLSDYLVKDDYGYFRKMQRPRRRTEQPHAPPPLPARAVLRAAEARDLRHAGRDEEAVRQAARRSSGRRSATTTEDTLRAAKSCGIKAAPLWNEEVFVDHWEYREWDRDLHPGDIVLTHFRGKEDWKGTMPDMVRRFMKTVTDKGYAVARLEDYL